jgi:hypothetical protein
MADETKFTEREGHKKFAVDCFNHVWALLEKKNRTPEDDEEMIHAVHASRFHWSRVGTAVNLARGDWQMSRVYAVLKLPEPAKHYAQRCLDICMKNQIGDFDLAYAYEALARAAAVAGDHAERDRCLAEAVKVAATIKGKEDQEVFLADLKTICD